MKTRTFEHRRILLPTPSTLCVRTIFSRRNHCRRRRVRGARRRVGYTPPKGQNAQISPKFAYNSIDVVKTFTRERERERFRRSTHLKGEWVLLNLGIIVRRDGKIPRSSILRVRRRVVIIIIIVSASWRSSSSFLFRIFVQNQLCRSSSSHLPSPNHHPQNHSRRCSYSSSREIVAASPPASFAAPRTRLSRRRTPVHNPPILPLLSRCWAKSLLVRRKHNWHMRP